MTDVLTGSEKAAEPAPGRGPVRRLRAGLGRHRLFAGVLVLAVVVRGLALLGQRPGEMYWYDSYEYLRFALEPHPARNLHPGGYGFFLWLLKPFHSIPLIIVLQHLMGLAVGVLGYAVLRRRGLPAWGASLAMIAPLFDVELLHLEHAVLSDTPFMLLVTGAVIVLLWSPEITWRAATGASLLLACAALVRTIALPLLVLVLIWMAVRRVAWRSLLVAALVAAVPIVSYATWYHSEYGRFKLAGGDGASLWARTRTFVDCDKVKPPPAEAKLCPDGVQTDAASEYYWIGEINRPPGRTANEDLARSFALRAIMAQPLDYLWAVTVDVSRTFAYPAVAHPKRLPPVYYFTAGTVPLSGEPGARGTALAYDPGVSEGTRSVGPYDGWLAAYKVHIPGPALLIVLLLGAWGLVRRRGGGPGTRRAVLLPWGVAVSLLVAPVAVLGFDHRYAMPALPLACLAAALMFARHAKAPAEPNETDETTAMVGETTATVGETA
ncbi:hypothetical protein ACGFNU_50220 [Spirillospora sp. NPDC048911]|uniref:hypothetical protein n=1 Tax=Spirillospora sp. NPDC048911 TaxID=3364527 RepID=UPI00371061C2